MSRPAVILVTVCAWLVACGAAAHDYVVSNLALPGPDAYANHAGFQSLMFALFRLPYWLAALPALLFAEAVMFELFPPKSGARRARV